MLTKEEKIKFIKDILDTMRESLLKKVDKMPEEWDGYELRRLIADYAEEKIAYFEMNKPRLRAYDNTRIVRNI